MKKRFSRFALLGLIFMMVVSCTGSKILMQDLARYPQPLGYGLISPVAMTPKTDSVIVTFTGFPLDSLTTVSQEKCLVLPFIFLNYVDAKYRIKLGSNLMTQDYNDFFFNAMLDESGRSGEFALCYDSIRGKDKYILEVSLDNCQTETYYFESIFLMVYIYGYFSTFSESSFPAQSTITCSTRLRKGDQIVRDSTFTVSTELDFPSSNNMSHRVRFERTAGNMVEALCQSTRSCITKIVREVNSTLAAQKR